MPVRLLAEILDPCAHMHAALSYETMTTLDRRRGRRRDMHTPKWALNFLQRFPRHHRPKVMLADRCWRRKLMRK